MVKTAETTIGLRQGDRRWYAFQDGWVLTKLSGLRGPVEYSPQPYAGSMGSALGGGYIGGVQFSVELAFGNPNPLRVAEVVSSLCSMLQHGGPPSVWVTIYPMGFQAFYQILAATPGPKIEYSHGGCLAVVSIDFYCNDYRFQQYAALPEEEGKVPW